MSAARTAPSASVLVVDDDRDLRTLLGLALRRAGLDVLEAESGEEALEVIEAGSVGVVVCDFRMAGMTGLELVQTLRSRPGTSTLPCILMTGSGDADSVIEGLTAGADDFLAKPVRLEELVARVRAHLRTHAAWTEVVQNELRTRAEAVQAIGQLSLSSVPDEAAAAIVGELARRTGAGFVAVLQLTGQSLQPLASFNPRDGIVRGGPPPSVRRTRFLLARADRPWAEPGGSGQSLELDEPESSGGLEIAAGAPIYAGETVVGLLTIGLRQGESGPSPVARRANLLASVIDYAGVLSALAGPAIADRRRAAANLAQLRLVLGRGGMFPVYQPVVALTSGQPVGFEALTRFKDGSAPDVRFAEAAAAGLADDFQLAAIEAALDGAADLADDTWLSVNVSPDVVLNSSRRLGQILAAASRDLVIEVTENARILDYEVFRSTIGRFGGVRLAVDDAGAGYASLRHILELKPAFAKLDISLVRGIDGDPLRQAMASGLAYYAARTGCRLIAEGVERGEEAETLSALGIELAQGNLFGHPTPIAA